MGEGKNVKGEKGNTHLTIKSDTIITKTQIMAKFVSTLL